MLGIGQRRIQQLVRAGTLPGAGRGVLKFPAAIQAYVSYVENVAQSRAPDRSGQLYTEKVRKLTGANNRAEEGLIDTEEAILVIGMIVDDVVKEIANLGNSLVNDGSIQPKSKPGFKRIIGSIRKRHSEEVKAFRSLKGKKS